MEKFKELGLNANVLKSIEKLGFNTPSKIQEEMIPLIMQGYDLIGQAQTGTGKTLAYAASILSKINVKSNTVKCIILVPTRELAVQVSEEFISLNVSREFDILAVYGGSSIGKQMTALERGVDIVVGTPGRVMDLIKRKKLGINTLEVFVLDEADEMLDMGFLEDIETIFKATNEEKQVLMLSATMPKGIKKLATNYMKSDYQHILIESTSKTADNITQFYYLVNEKSRLEALCRVLDLKDSKRSIIFCQTKKECDELLDALAIKKYNVEVMHGDIIQEMRIKTLDRFKKNAFNILIATDVAARGIHVNDIDLVINYRLPDDLETYIHRIGRTGRVNSSGEAINFVNQKDLRKISEIEKFVNCKVNKSEVPTKEEIESSRYEAKLQEVFHLTRSGYNESAFNYVRDLNKGDLINLAATLLRMAVNRDIGSNFEKKIEVVEQRGSSVKKGTTRLFLTIGKKDKINKNSLLDFIKDTAGISKSNLRNVEVLDTFTFVDADESVCDKLIKSIHNTKLNNRIIRVEKAKRQK
jgi:Superfamily II DNA and RNA helicases